MKHFIFSGLIGWGALAFLAGCGDEAKTSDYYKAHLDEAKARVAECKKNGENEWNSTKGLF